MSSAETTGPPVDFALLGNTEWILRWLADVLRQSPGIRLQERGGGDWDTAPHEGELTGTIVAGLDPAKAPRSVPRIGVILEDPVRLLAEEGQEAMGAPGYYGSVASLIAGAPGEVLVVPADELVNSRADLKRMLDHLCGERAVTSTTNPPVPVTRPPMPAPLSRGRRAQLFAQIREEVEQLELLTGQTFRSWRFGGGNGSGHPSALSSSLFYFGRLRDTPVPDGSLGLSDRDVLPVMIAPLLDSAERLTVLDAMSFPFDALREHDWDIPIAVHLPPGVDGEALSTIFEQTLFSEITPLDRVSCTPEASAALLARHNWSLATFAPLHQLEQDMAWRGCKIAREEKSNYRTRRRALSQQLNSACASIPAGEQPRTLVLAENVGRWCSLAGQNGAVVHAVDLDQAAVATAEGEYPDIRLDNVLPPEARVETAHIVLMIDALCSCDRRERRTRLAAMLRNLRVGGRLIVLDRFLTGLGGHALPVPTPRELLADILEVSARHLVLEHVEALRLHGEDLFSIGLFTFTKLGQPERM